VNTWEAYNRWGGKSLYQFGTSRHALEVTFDRPFDQQTFHDMVTKLELPWIAAATPFDIRDRPRRVLDPANARRLQPGAGAVDEPDVRLQQRRVADAL